MHPDLQKIAAELQAQGDDLELSLRFGLACLEQVSSNLESDESIEALEKFRSLLGSFDDQAREDIRLLASRISEHATSHPGSKSLDGSRHAAVSATYALAKALSGKAIDAAAYAAYSAVYA